MDANFKLVRWSGLLERIREWVLESLLLAQNHRKWSDAQQEGEYYKGISLWHFMANVSKKTCSEVASVIGWYKTIFYSVYFADHGGTGNHRVILCFVPRVPVVFR